MNEPAVELASRGALVAPRVFLGCGGKVLGFEFAGQVAALGGGVTRFAVGDSVFGSAGIGMGAHAELLCLQDGSNVQARPAHLSPQEAAAILMVGQQRCTSCARRVWRPMTKC